MTDQILNIYKPAGITSFDVIRQLKRHYPGVKIGHAGTLDPFAEGVLLIAFGKKTKEISKLQEMQKEYLATMEFGSITTTYDPEGIKIAIFPKFDQGGFEQQKQFFPHFEPKILQKKVTISELQALLPQYIGQIDQIPPVFSAKKVRGERSYKLARQGKPLALATKKVMIYSIDIVDFQWPYATLRMVCGSGTYIRSLAYDIGCDFGCGAYLTKLVRTKIGDYRIEDAIKN